MPILTSQKKTTLGILILIGLSFIGNYLKWSFFFNIDFLFGTIFVWIALCLYGKRWGILAGTLAATYTYFLWLHPYAFIIFAGEAIFVSLLWRRNQHNLVLLDGIYWISIGMPLVWIFYVYVLHVNPVQAQIILLKQPINGIFNALVANLLLNYLPIHQWVNRPQAKNRLTLRQTFLNLLIVFAFFPTLAMMIIESRGVVDTIKVTAQIELKIVTNDLTIEIQNWHQQHLKALQELSRKASQTTGLSEFQNHVKFTQKVFSDFENIILIDSEGKIINSFKSPINQELKFNLSAFIQQIKQAQKAQPIDFFQASFNPGNNPGNVLLAVPIYSNQKNQSFMIGDIRLDQLQSIIFSHMKQRNGNVTLVNRKKSVITSNLKERIGIKNFDRKQDGDIQFLDSNTYHWLPTTGSHIVMVRWNQSYFVQETQLANNIPWTLIVELPVAPHVIYIEKVNTKNLFILMLISGVAIIFAELLSKDLVNPLSKLANVTTNLPNKLLEGESIHWPTSRITELASLVQNFHIMATTLTQKFQEIRTTNETLELRVQQRTEELVNINQQLEIEILERQEIEAALRESEERFRQMADNIREVVWMASVDKKQVLYVSPAYEIIWGKSCKSLYKNPFSYQESIHPEDREQQKQALRQQHLGKYNIEYRIIQPNGEIRWIWDRAFPIQNETGKIYRLVGVAQDITERKLAEEQLLHHALYDTLTGLPNRALFLDRLKQATARLQRYPEYKFAVLFLDLDRFKVVNDSLGHLVGDQLLIATAKRLQNCLRLGDTVARLGGDEFTILLDNIRDINDAVGVCEEIHHSLESPFYLDDYEVFTTASIGIALSDSESEAWTKSIYQNPENLLRNADTAMYRAKRQGSAYYAVFDTVMYNQAVELLQLETDLRKAIERQELRVFYQPIVLLNTGQLTGFEALVRWQHPTQGLVSPARFIPIAEETGLIIAIDRWVLQEACWQLSQWKTKFTQATNLTISVNLSVRQFSQPDLVQHIQGILETFNCSPGFLKIEIIESGVMKNAKFAAQLLDEFKTLGVQISIDDFGTGYSSLSRLHEFPIDTLKIDRSFIDRMAQDQEGIKIVQSIIGLAHNLGMDVVAEGIETLEQSIILQGLNCEKGQGYFFASPLSSEAATELIAREKNRE